MMTHRPAVAATTLASVLRPDHFCSVGPGPLVDRSVVETTLPVVVDTRAAERYMTSKTSETRMLAPPSLTGQSFADSTAALRSAALMIE